MHSRFSGKSILVTGHTGFKGAWLSELLLFLGAEVTGVSLDPEATSLYEHLQLSQRVKDHRLDIRNLSSLQEIVSESTPDLIIHLAAQSLVQVGKEFPLDNFSTNIMGTVNILESARQSSTAPVLVVTSDKCYWPKSSPCKVGDTLGGKDPYSASKAAVEIIVQSYRDSYNMSVATARAGNAIGGGDWGKYRLIPDIMRAKYHGEKLTIRSPSARRPWQHVLDLSWGYINLCSQLMEGKAYRAWNFGPDTSITVREMVDALGASSIVSYSDNPVDETLALRLEIAETAKLLGWKNHLDWRTAVRWTAQDYQALHDNPAGFSRWIQNRIGQYLKMF